MNENNRHIEGNDKHKKNIIISIYILQFHLQ